MLERSVGFPVSILIAGIIWGPTLCRGDSGSKSTAEDRTSHGAAITGGVVAATALSNIDKVVLRSMIQPNLLKGGFGEEHMNRHLVKHFAKTGGWSPLQARLGSQGIDGLYLKYDSSGHPTGLIVSEAKYGSSQLKATADGIQMGKTWRTNRLDAMGKNYRSIAESIRTGKMPLARAGGSVGKQRLQINIPGSGKAAVFSRSAVSKPWEFVGPKRLMSEAGPQAERLGRYLQQASRGEVAYDSMLYRIKIKDGALHVRIKDAGMLGVGVAESNLSTSHSFKIPLTERRLANSVIILRSEVAKQLRNQFPQLRSGEVDAYAKRIVRDTQDLETVLNNRPPSVVSAIAWNSVKIGGVAAVLDLTTDTVKQYWATGTVRWRDVAISGGIAFGSSFAGAAIGQGTSALLLRSSLAHHLVTRTSAVLGLGSTRLLPQMIGGAVGGGVTSVLFAIGGYYAGYYDASTAARMGVVGVSSTALGMAASGGLLALATTFGTASTGTAIATLHGAAATSAAMAWLGGGAAAAGGGGAAVGGAVLTGGAVIVVVGTGYLIN